MYSNNAMIIITAVAEVPQTSLQLKCCNIG